MKNKIATTLLWVLVGVSLYLHVRAYTKGVFTRRLAILDDSGQIRIALACGNDRTTLSFIDPPLTPRATIGVVSGKSGIALFDSTGNGRIL